MQSEVGIPVQCPSWSILDDLMGASYLIWWDKRATISVILQFAIPSMSGFIVNDCGFMWIARRNLCKRQPSGLGIRLNWRYGFSGKVWRKFPAIWGTNQRDPLQGPWSFRWFEDLKTKFESSSSPSLHQMFAN